MKTRKLIQGFAAVAIAVTFAPGAFAAEHDFFPWQRDSQAPVQGMAGASPRANAPFGSPAQGMPAARVVKLNADAKYLNIQRGEVVTVVNGEKTFTWRFDTLGTPTFELAKIAPQDFGTGHIVVYVADDVPS